METTIVLLLGLIAVWVWSLNIKMSDFGERMESLDYPFYNLQAIKIAKMEWEYWEKEHEKRSDTLFEYTEKHKEELDKIKKNKDHSQEYRDLIQKYHSSIEQSTKNRQELNWMLEANYAIKSGRKTFSQVGNEWRMKWKNNLKIKESMYESWLKH